MVPLYEPQAPCVPSLKWYHIMVDRQDKAPLDSGKSTRTTSNGVNLRHLVVSVFRLRTHNLATGHKHRFGRADSSRIDAVSVGRDPMTRPCGSRCWRLQFLRRKGIE